MGLLNPIGGFGGGECLVPGCIHETDRKIVSSFYCHQVLRRLTLAAFIEILMHIKAKDIVQQGYDCLKTADFNGMTPQPKLTAPKCDMDIHSKDVTPYLEYGSTTQKCYSLDDKSHI